MASAEFLEVLRLRRERAVASGLRSAVFDLAVLRAERADPFPLAPTVDVRAVDAGGVPAEWVIEAGVDTRRRLLYLHGGGYVAGSVRSSRALASWISQGANCAVLLPDYRLAPEHPFPHGLNDCNRAYAWLRDNGPEGAGTSTRIYIGGASAGGGLTLALLLQLKGRGQPQPDAAFSISAWADFLNECASRTTRSDADPIVSTHQLPDISRLYLGETDPREPLASPVYGDFAGVAPLLVQVGDAEVLLDDSVKAAERAREAGVETTLEVWPEMIHVWHSSAPLFPEGQEAIEHITAFLRSH